MSPQNERAPAFHIASKSKSYSHRGSNNLSGSVPEGMHERTALSLDLERRPTGVAKDGILSSEVRLRGGAGQHWAGKFEWLSKDKGMKTTMLDENELEQHPSKVTYRGKEIGPPQPAPAINVLPPASRFAREPEARTASTARASFGNNDDDGHLPTSTRYDHPGAAYIQARLQPPPQDLLPTQSRPATTHPFAGVYGNPYAIRTGPISPSVDYEIAGSLIDRPSALYGSQTGYTSRHDQTRRSPLRSDRKWSVLPPLPAGEGGNEANDETFDTEEVLASLRPERLSLYHIATPVRSIAGSATSRDAAAASAQWLSQEAAANSRPIDHNIYRAPDGYSIRTRDWDLHSCDTTDVGIDGQERRHEQHVKLSPQRQLLEEQQDHLNFRNDNEAVYGLPEEDAINPESWFYAEMIEIVNDYHEQLQTVVHRAYEAGQISEEQWMREKWTNRVALDRKLRRAEKMSDYKVHKSS